MQRDENDAGGQTPSSAGAGSSVATGAPQQSYQAQPHAHADAVPPLAPVAEGEAVAALSTTRSARLKAEGMSTSSARGSGQSQTSGRRDFSSLTSPGANAPVSATARTGRSTRTGRSGASKARKAAQAAAMNDMADMLKFPTPESVCCVVYSPGLTHL